MDILMDIEELVSTYIVIRREDGSNRVYYRTSPNGSLNGINLKFNRRDAERLAKILAPACDRSHRETLATLNRITKSS